MMCSFFSLGRAVTLACIQGLIQAKGVFLRTPKTISSSKMLSVLSVTRWVTLIGLVCVGVGAQGFIANPTYVRFLPIEILLYQLFSFK